MSTNTTNSTVCTIPPWADAVGIDKFGEFAVFNESGVEFKFRKFAYQGDTYYMLDQPVTQKQWLTIRDNNPAHFKDSLDNPVEMVSWNDCTAWCKDLSARRGIEITLPDEKVWQYACQCGTDQEVVVTDETGWYSANSGGKTHPVKQKKPNAWGLYDMLGNVWEWCQNPYRERA